MKFNKLMVFLAITLASCGHRPQGMPELEKLVQEHCDSNCTIAAGVLHINPETKEFFVLQDNSHTAIGIDRVETHPDYIDVFFTEYQDYVILADAHEDDAYAAYGIHFGVSGWNDRMRISWTLGKSLDDLNIPGSAVWLFSIGKL